jgi:hypothetical protein
MKLKISGALIFTFFISAIVVASLVTSREWSFATRLFPWAIGIPALALCAIQLFFEIWKTRSAAAEEKDSGIMDLQVERGIPPGGKHIRMDLRPIRGHHARRIRHHGAFVCLVLSDFSGS